MCVLFLCSSCLLLRCLTFILPPLHLPCFCFPFDLLSGVQFFFGRNVPVGFGCGSDEDFDAGVEAALSLNPLASVTGTAAEC